MAEKPWLWHTKKKGIKKSLFGVGIIELQYGKCYIGLSFQFHAKIKIEEFDRNLKKDKDMVTRNLAFEACIYEGNKDG